MRTYITAEQAVSILPDGEHIANSPAEGMPLPKPPKEDEHA